jgi:hypothetical protein
MPHTLLPRCPVCFEVSECPVCAGQVGGLRTAKLHPGKAAKWGKMAPRPGSRPRGRPKKTKAGAAAAN